MALIGSFQFGYQIAVLNTSLSYVSETLHIPESSSALIASSILVGALFGALGAGCLADALGPKKATVLNTIPLALGSLLSAVAPSELVLITARLFTGIGIGAASLLVPRYLTEIAPKSIRGLLATLNQLFINIGIMFAFLGGWPLESSPFKEISFLGFEHLQWWRVMFLAGVIPAFVQAVGMACCPETHVWLLWSGLHLQASKSYRLLHGTTESSDNEDDDVDVDVDVDEDAVLLIDNGQQQQQQELEPSRGFSALFEPKYHKIMLLAIGLPVLQQFGGINTVILYGTKVFAAAGVQSAIKANLMMSVVNTATTIIAAFLMDRAGRKALITFSFAGMGASLALMSAFLLLPTPEKFSATATIICILAYTIFFALGCGPVPWVYLPEILPPAIKGSAQAFCTMLNWLGNMCVGFSFPLMLKMMGLGGSYALYAVFCVGAAVFCGKLMVETKQRSLAAVHAELMSGAGG